MDAFLAFCRFAALFNKERKWNIETQKLYDRRDVKLALIVSTGSAIIQILEKALKYYPSLIEAMDSFGIFEGGHPWETDKRLNELQSISDFKRTKDYRCLRNYLLIDDYNPPPDRLVVQDEVAKMLVNSIALLYRMSSTLLKVYFPDESKYNEHGTFSKYIGGLSDEELNFLLQLYRACKDRDDIEEFLPSNFERSSSKAFSLLC